MPGARAACALVIGAGVGGLTAAAALHRAGWDVLVLERAGGLTGTGAALAITTDAIRAVDVIGHGDAVRARATWSGDGELRLPSGRRLARTNARARLSGSAVPWCRCPGPT